MDYFKITTDETLRETVQHGSERYPFAYYPEDIWQFDFHRIDWHWHHELEFLYVAEGTAICFIGTSKVELHKGCGIFINSGVLHCFEARSSTFTPNIVFSPTLLASENSLIYEKYILPVINSAVEYQIFDPNSTSERSALRLMLQIFELQENGRIMNYVPYNFCCSFGIYCLNIEAGILIWTTSNSQIIIRQDCKL